MDIIAAHRQGLIEQLDEEVAALAGRPRYHAQRAVVLHHLYDHSRGNLRWALAEARHSLRLAAGLAALARQLSRWGWLVARRGEAEASLAQLAEALGDAARARTISVYRAHRLTGTPALREAAETELGASLAALLEQCHASRRTGKNLTAHEQEQLASRCELLAAGSVEAARVQAAWDAIEATGLRRAARRLLGDKALAKGAAKDARRGSARVELELRRDAALPATFRANPAQHFYALRQMLRDRRRQEWREACDLAPDAFELAA